MNLKKIAVFIIIIFFVIPISFYYLKPEVDLKNKYLKFSWSKSNNELSEAIKSRKTTDFLKKIYSDFFSSFEDTRFEGKIRETYTDYSLQTRNTVQNFLKRWKNFIAVPAKNA